jgi:hypothetical protein
MKAVGLGSVTTQKMRAAEAFSVSIRIKTGFQIFDLTVS